MIESQIKQVLGRETRVGVLSDTFFGPQGLFNQLAPTEDERRQLVQLPLFRQAMARLTELRRAEAAEFARTVQQSESTLSESGCCLKAERLASGKTP